MTTDTQYGSLREKIAAEKAERQDRYTAFEALWDRAQKAGREAAESAVPSPMVVYEADGLSDRPKPGGDAWYVSEGVCGFAWILVRPGNSSFAHWLKKQGLATKAYYGGVSHWIGQYGQSYERKMAHAQAAAQVLREGLEGMGMGNVKVYGQGRLD